MNRILLAGIALALPSFAAAAPCNILPYANQCQGSNLWPVPAGWIADNNGDCQPQPPSLTYHAPTSYYAANSHSAESKAELYAKVVEGGEGRLLQPGEVYSASWNNYGCTGGSIDGDVYGTIMYPVFYLRPSSCNGDTRPMWGSHSYIHLIPSCATGQFPLNVGKTVEHPPEYPMAVLFYLEGFGGRNTRPNWEVCYSINSPSTLKPSDGVCTARWTSSDKTALQKDPLDPDCDANSCVKDGTCRLR